MVAINGRSNSANGAYFASFTLASVFLLLFGIIFICFVVSTQKRTFARTLHLPIPFIFPSLPSSAGKGGR
jgi:hypothetical protein